jgi:two-component system sensor histidine kinase SenX3
MREAARFKTAVVTHARGFMDVPMWLVILLVVLACAALLEAFFLWRLLWSRRAHSRELARVGSRAALTATSSSYMVFPPSIPADEAAARLLSSVVSAAVVVDERGSVRFSSLEAGALKLTRSGRVDSEEIEEIVDSVRADGVSRTRETHFTAPGSPPLEKWLRTTVRKIGDDRILILADDASAEHRFAQQRRDFITNVAHELKTPNGAIGLLAETIAGAAEDSDAVAYFAERIGIESRRLNALVARLIELEKVQDMSQLGQSADFDASAVVKSAVAALAVTSEERGVKVSTEVSPSLTVHGQQSLLHSAVRNLVENALHYSPAGSTVHVTAALNEERGNVLIRVVDQGEGIPQEALPRIFERFYRVDATRGSATGGSGIGLSIVKHSVEGLGGKVSVWSKQGEGSTFTIEIPAVHAAPVITGSAVEGEHRDAGRGKDTA